VACGIANVLLTCVIKGRAVPMKLLANEKPSTESSILLQVPSGKFDGDYSGLSNMQLFMIVLIVKSLFDVTIRLSLFRLFILEWT
jgi:hypothetical protein